MQFAHDDLLRRFGQSVLPLSRRMNAFARTIGALMTGFVLGGCSGRSSRLGERRAKLRS